MKQFKSFLMGALVTGFIALSALLVAQVAFLHSNPQVIENVIRVVFGS